MELPLARHFKALDVNFGSYLQFQIRQSMFQELWVLFLKYRQLFNQRRVHCQEDLQQHMPCSSHMLHLATQLLSS